MSVALTIGFVALLMTATRASPLTAANTGTIWQISDIHYDANYSTFGVPGNMCHLSKDVTDSSPGYYGNYLCDAPWALVKAVIAGMKALEPQPDFIFWTGDTVPHVKNSDISVMKVYKTIGNISTLLQTTFPNVSIFPVLGNHDAYPSDQMPEVVASSGYYDDILTVSGWNQLLGKTESEDFRKGGFFVSSLSNNRRIIGLNTNLFYSLNHKSAGIKDPNQQLAWLEHQLEDAKTNMAKVYLISHIPPGAFERSRGLKWFYPEFNKPYVSLLQKYSNVILAQFYGHEHTDSFRVLYSLKGDPVNVMFLSPAVTPWKSTLPGVGANNPSIRLYHYDLETGHVLDYFQYFLNLTAANKYNQSNWQLEYQASKAYALKNMSPASFNQLTKSFYIDTKTFSKYLNFNSVSYDTNSSCNSACFLSHLCAITMVDFTLYDKCLFSGGTTRTPDHRTTHHPYPRGYHQPVPHYVFYILGSMGLVIVVLAAIVGCLCVRKRQQGVPFKYSRIVAVN